MKTSRQAGKKSHTIALFDIALKIDRNINPINENVRGNPKWR